MIPATGPRGSGSDVADVAVYLASGQSAYVNGIALTVDGGWLADKSFAAGEAATSTFLSANETTDSPSSPAARAGPGGCRRRKVHESLSKPGRAPAYNRAVFFGVVSRGRRFCALLSALCIFAVG